MSQRITQRTVTNPLNEPFTFGWDSVPYTIPAKSTVMLVDFLAVHAAKHLADRLLIDSGKYEDEIRGDKRVYKAVTENQLNLVMDALLDREDEKINLDEILKEPSSNEFEGKGEVNVLPTVELKKNVSKKVEVKDDQTTTEPEPSDVATDITDERIKFDQLKTVGYLKLNKDDRALYQSLKAKFNQ